MKEQNKSMKSLYPTAFVLYLSFFVHGFGAAILSQNTKYTKHPIITVSLLPNLSEIAPEKGYVINLPIPNADIT